MGIGGLDHLAVKIASAMGCQVIVFSCKESKRREAFEFGAPEFHVLHDGQPLAESLEPVDHLLLCGSAKVDYHSCV
jgi:D-arabinose 1-dehydrogenase-like Zn-dependent alcohol dehydrogenase